MSIGIKIKHHRRLMGITQEELAKNLGITPQAISKWETSEGMPDISLLVPLACFFDTTVDALLSEPQTRVRSGYGSHRERLLTRFETDLSAENFDKAASAYEEIIIHGQPSVKDLWHYAYLFERRARNDLKKSLRYYKMATQQEGASDKEIEAAYAQLIALLIYLGKQDEAIDTLKAWQEASPNAINPLVQLANIYMITNQAQIALDYCKQAEQMNQTNAGLFLVAGDVHEALSNHDLALEMWDKSFAIDSSTANALFSKAELLAKLDKTNDAIVAWQACVDWLVRQGYDQEGELEYPKSKIAALQNVL